jgi:hypothetical protein
MNIRDVCHSLVSQFNQSNGCPFQDSPRSDASPRDLSNGQGVRSKFDRGPRTHHGPNLNGIHANKKPFVKQRVPNADDFPVLGGSTTPPARQPNGAPTAAQVLQAPPPVKKEASQASTRGPSPDLPKVNGTIAKVRNRPMQRVL